MSLPLLMLSPPRPPTARRVLGFGWFRKAAPAKKPAAPPEPAPPPSREDQGKHVLGHTTSKKPVYASGADGAGYSDDEHQEAARLHAAAHLHHTQTAEKLRAGADADDDWQRSEGQHQRAAAHDKLAEHHHALVRDHLIAGGHGGRQEMGWDEKRGSPKLGKVVPHGAKERAEAKERLKTRAHAEHPGGTSDVDRQAYAPQKKARE
jgi:hypothetical protein